MKEVSKDDIRAVRLLHSIKLLEAPKYIYAERRAVYSPPLPRKPGRNLEERRAAGRARYHANKDLYKDCAKRRRAVMAKAVTERISSHKVFERDGWTCQLCLEPVDEYIAHPDPLSKSLDHVIPLSKGGSHTYDNLQLAHLVCNLRKHDKIITPISRS